MRLTRLFLLAFVMMCSVAAFAQAPQSFNYQGVLRNSSGTIQANAAITARFTVRQGGTSGTSVYQETHSVSTNAYGIFTAKIGNGTPVSGAFNTIDWSTGNYYLQTEVNPGSGFVDLGASQLISVPYSLYSEKSGKAINMAINDLTDVTSTGPSTGQVLKWNGTQWVPDTDLQGGGGGSYTAGTGINITGTVISNTGDTNPSDDITNSTSAGGDLTGTYPNPSVAGIRGIGVSNTAPTSGQVLKYNGTQWIPDNDLTGGGGGSYSAGPGIQIVGSQINNIGDTNPADDITTSTSAGGDLSGTYPSPSVHGLYGRPLSSNAPSTGQVLKWNGTNWMPDTDLTGGGGSYTAGTGISISGNVITNTGDTNPADDLTTSTVFSGDVTGTYNATTVGKIQGRTVAATAPTTNQVLQWTGTQWAPGTVSGGSYTGGTGITISGSTINSVWTASGTSIYNNNTGNVGINTTLPTARFYVNGAGTSTTTTPNGLSNYVSIYANLSSVSATENSGIVGYATGSSLENNGIVGFAGAGAGVNVGTLGIGETTTSGTNVGLYGSADNSTTNNYGIFGVGLTGATNGVGVYGSDDNDALNWAGYFNGDVNVTGTLYKGAVSWRLDHPMDPANRYLTHVALESPEMLNVYSGNVTTDANGLATVELPSYFGMINSDFRYQLTPIGSFTQAIVKEEVRNNQFVIQTSTPNVKVSWQVSAVRSDDWANAHRTQPESEKPAHLKGKYLHPELFGMGQDKALLPAPKRPVASNPSK